MGDAGQVAADGDGDGGLVDVAGARGDLQRPLTRGGEANLGAGVVGFRRVDRHRDRLDAGGGQSEADGPFRDGQGPGLRGVDVDVQAVGHIRPPG